jgi:hypothetical protein
MSLPATFEVEGPHGRLEFDVDRGGVRWIIVAAPAAKVAEQSAGVSHVGVECDRRWQPFGDRAHHVIKAIGAFRGHALVRGRERRGDNAVGRSCPALMSSR